MRRFTLSALVALTVLGLTLGNPMLARAQDAASAPIPVFMPPLSAYAPLPPPPPPPVIVVSAPACEPACEPAPECAPVCTPPVTACRPACPAPAPVRFHQRFERSHERTARRGHEVRCRR